ncbi:MAG TPA: hypothetical protein VG759_17245 [Candidatus Angelobacter sp.]|nr:hypothetical protein [Candidatus Angelobacter sp.]
MQEPDLRDEPRSLNIAAALRMLQTLENRTVKRGKLVLSGESSHQPIRGRRRGLLLQFPPGVESLIINYARNQAKNICFTIELTCG